MFAWLWDASRYTPNSGKRKTFVPNTAYGFTWCLIQNHIWKFLISKIFFSKLELRMWMRSKSVHNDSRKKNHHQFKYWPFQQLRKKSDFLEKKFSRSVLRMYLRGSTIKSEVKDELFLSRTIGSQHILGVLHWVHQDTHLQRMTKLNNGYRQTIQIFFTTSIFISQKHSIKWIFLCLKRF